MPKKMKISDEEVARIAEKCKTKSRAEVAEEMGWDRKKVHNILQRYKRNQSKIAKTLLKKELPPGKPIKVTSIEQSTTPESSGKAMVIITTDINMIKKLIGDL